MIPLILIAIGIILIIYNYKTMSKGTTSFEFTLNEEKENLNDYKLELGILRKDIGESLTELQQEIKAIKINLNMTNDIEEEYDNILDRNIEKLEFDDEEMVMTKKESNIKDNINSEKVNVEEFIDIIFFDSIIGNTDRHSENWGIIRNYEEDTKKVSAAYDNGSSLGREFHSKEEKISSLNIQTYTSKAKSCIRIIDTKRISHYEFLAEILKKFPHKKDQYLKKIELLTEEGIENIINRIPEEFMSLTIKEFVKKILLERKKNIKEILKKEDSND